MTAAETDADRLAQYAQLAAYRLPWNPPLARAFECDLSQLHFSRLH